MAKVEDGHLPFVESAKPLHNSIPDHLAPNFEPAFLEYYNKYTAGRLATHQVPIEKFRADPAKYTITYGRDRVPSDGVTWSDLKCPVDGGEITVRVFEPAFSSTDKPRPVYINYHGGGWVFGGLVTDFDLCKRIVRELGCVVFDVDYRLSPEYKFPIPVNDSIAAFHWVSKKHTHSLTQSLPSSRGEQTRLFARRRKLTRRLCSHTGSICRFETPKQKNMAWTSPASPSEVLQPVVS